MKSKLKLCASLDYSSRGRDSRRTRWRAANTTARTRKKTRVTSPTKWTGLQKSTRKLRETGTTSKTKLKLGRPNPMSKALYPQVATIWREPVSLRPKNSSSRRHAAASKG